MAAQSKFEKLVVARIAAGRNHDGDVHDFGSANIRIDSLLHIIGMDEGSELGPSEHSEQLGDRSVRYEDSTCGE